MSELFKPEYLPTYESSGAAGMDLRACMAQPTVMHPGERLRIPTGIAMQWDGNAVVGLVYARSGLAWRKGIGLPNGVGVIDSDYTGEIQVLLTNFGPEDVTIAPGDRIAQIVFTPIYTANLIPAAKLEGTERGSHGFGSTGMR